MDTDRLAIAAHLFLLMRRKLSRSIDAEWLAQNRAYAAEIVRLCRQSQDDELLEWSHRLEMAYLKMNGHAESGALSPNAPPAPPQEHKATGGSGEHKGGDDARYVRGLR